MKFNKNDIFTGLFVIGGIVLSISIVLLILGYGVFENRVAYYIRMEQLAGVKKGTPIKIKNYTVGEVQEVVPIFGSNIYFKARVLIDKNFVIFRGTKVNITNQNVIGDTVIRLYQPDDRLFKLNEGDTLFASNIVNLDEMVAQISNMISNINDIVSVFGKLAGNSQGDLKMLMGNLNSAIVKVNGLLDASQSEIVAIMKNIRQTSQTLNKFTADISKNPWKILNGDSKPNSGGSSVLP